MFNLLSFQPDAGLLTGREPDEESDMNVFEFQGERTGDGEYLSSRKKVRAAD